MAKGFGMKAALAGMVLALGLPQAGAAETGRAAAFVAVVRANGCTITEAEGATLLPAAGLTVADAQDAVQILNRGALFTVSDDAQTLILTPELCAADADQTAALLAAAAAAAPRVQLLPLDQRVDPEAGARLIGALRANGCAMTEDQAAAILPGLGFQPETVQDIAGLLLEAGMASYGDAALRLDPEVCAAAPERDADWIAAALDQLAGTTAPGPAAPDLPGVRGAIALWLMGQGCTLDLADRAAARALLTGAVLARYGLTDPSDDVLAAIAGHVDTTLDAPGPAYTQEPGRLRLIHCTP